ncbi:MAG: VWA domain-containing protein [Bacteroidales bacterium]|nr:VWA domain-containing protein [Bacteroidales bacterium]
MSVFKSKNKISFWLKFFYHFEQQYLRVVILSLILVIGGLELVTNSGMVYAQTTEGELEGRAAPVALRRCVGGSNAGQLCNQDGSCLGSTCPDRNVFNISVAVQFNATIEELNTVKDMISDGSAWLFDVTDGQVEIGEAFIYNNAFGTGSDADLRIYPSTSPTWWSALAGGWQVGGSMHISIDNIPAVARPGESLAHEFFHLAFDAKDEYEEKAVGCLEWVADANCPDLAAITAGETPCLMGSRDHGPRSELCWGQGDPTDLTDVSGGNHDATNVTEQSRCRSNRSLWAQAVWAYPNTILAPIGAPDPEANGAIVNTTQFVIPDVTTRVVLVLDESGSMTLESPSRMERLKVAAKDFVALAEDGTELGIVSYSNDAEATSGRANVAIATLATNRTACNTAIDNLIPNNWTNIGDGLQKAIDMITNAGGVTANTFIVLMSDGLNNRPSPQSTADNHLQTAIDDLLNANIPVYVTCTGSDLGLASQCSEIATGTGGFYVDSEDPNRLAEAFIDFHERISRRDQITSFATWAAGNKPPLVGQDSIIYVEENTESATFILQWHESGIEANMFMVDPDGTEHHSTGMPKGRFVRISNPVQGDWQMVIKWSGNIPKNYLTRGYSRNRIHSLGAGVRYASVLPGEDIYIYAYPRSDGGPITKPNQMIMGSVTRPDGSRDIIELNDMGRNGDADNADGIYTGVYNRTNLKGPYQFLLRAEIDKWILSRDQERIDETQVSPRFIREVRVSVAVGDPGDIEPSPDDGIDKPDDQVNWCKWLFRLALLLFILLIWCIVKCRKQN